MTEKYIGCIRFLRKHKKLYLGGLAVLFILLAYKASQIGFDASDELWLSKKDQAPVFLKQNSFMALAFPVKVPLEAAPELSRKITAGLSGIPGILQVQDAKNLLKYRVPDRKKIPGNILVYYLDAAPAPGTKEFASMKNDIDKTMGNFREAGKYYLLGLNILHNEVIRTSKSDFRLFLPLSFLAGIIILMLIYRDPIKAAMPLVCMFITLSGTLGAFSLLGIPLMITTVIFPAVALVLCLNDSIYMLNAAMKSDEELKKIFMPCFQTALVLVIGFSALCFTGLKPVSYFGRMCLTGIFFSFFSAAAVIPVMITGGPAKPHGDIFRIGAAGWRVFYAFIFNNSKLILSAAVLTLVLCAAVLPGLRINMEALKYFKKAPELAAGFEFFRNNNIPADRFSLFIKSGKSGEPLKKLARISQEMDAMDGITGTFSAAKLAVQKMRMAGAGFLIPLNRESELDYMPDKEGYYRMDVFNNFASTGEFNIFHKKFKDTVKNTAGGEFDEKFSGGAYVSWRQERNLVRNQAAGFLCTFTLISVLFMAVFGFKIGAIAALENLFPVIITLATAVLCGITLNFTTVMIANVVIGLAAEDTIYLLRRYRESLKRKDPGDAFTMAAIEVGNSSVSSSLIMAAGFLVLLFSAFVPSVQLSLLVSVAIIAALAADMILLPVLLKAFTRARGPRERGKR